MILRYQRLRNFFINTIATPNKFIEGKYATSSDKNTLDSVFLTYILVFCVSTASINIMVGCLK